MIEVERVQPSGLFTNYIFKAIPLAFDESMSYYETLCGLLNYMKNTMIPALNNNADAVIELQGDFTTFTTNITNTVNQLEDFVNNYFDNLDVQEEINNKLDEMVEDGTLPEIIADYLNAKAIFAFDTVADMKESTNLINGSYAKTLGFYSKNDGGSALYKIRTITNDDVIDEMTILSMSDENLIAELIIENNSINVHQVGAKGDGTTDDTDKINKALSLNVTKVNFSQNKTYMIRGYEDGQATGGTTGLIETTGLIIPSNKIVDLNMSKIKIIPNGRQNYNGFTIKEVQNVVLKNGIIEGDRKTHTDNSGEWGYGVSIRYSSNITLENLKCIECWGDGININNNGDITTLCKNLYINNCICDSNRRQGMSIENGQYITVTNSQFINTGNDSYSTSPASGVDIEPLSDQYAKNIIFENCIFNNNHGNGIVAVGKIIDDTYCNIQDVKINNCTISGNTGNYSSSLSSFVIIEGLQINNSKFTNNVTYSLPFRSVGDFKVVNSYFEDVILLVYGGYMNKNKATFINNRFYNTTARPYNAVIETVDSPSGSTWGSDAHNTLEVIDNYIEVKDDIIVEALIKCFASARFNKLICKNNVLKHGKFGIFNKCSCIVDGNNFIAQRSPAMYIQEGTAYDVIDVRNNVFEETSNTEQYAGVLLNTNYSKNLILQNNTLYKNCLNVADQLTKTYGCNRFSQATTITGITLDANNNIFDNAIS